MGEHSDGINEHGGFLLWWDAETNDAGKFWAHEFSTSQSQLTTLVTDALLRCSPNASDESAFYDQVTGATGRMCSNQGGIPQSLTGCTLQGRHQGLEKLLTDHSSCFSRLVFQTDSPRSNFYPHLFLNKFGLNESKSKPKIKVSDCGTRLNQTLWLQWWSKIHNLLYLSHITDVKG